MAVCGCRTNVMLPTLHIVIRCCIPPRSTQSQSTNCNTNQQQQRLMIIVKPTHNVTHEQHPPSRASGAQTILDGHALHNPIVNHRCVKCCTWLVELAFWNLTATLSVRSQTLPRSLPSLSLDCNSTHVSQTKGAMWGLRLQHICVSSFTRKVVLPDVADHQTTCA